MTFWTFLDQHWIQGWLVLLLAAATVIRAAGTLSDLSGTVRLRLGRDEQQEEPRVRSAR